MMGGEHFSASVSLFSLRLAPTIYVLCLFISSSPSAFVVGSIMSTVDLTCTVMRVDFFFLFSVFFFFL